MADKPNGFANQVKSSPNSPPDYFQEEPEQTEEQAADGEYNNMGLEHDLVEERPRYVVVEMVAMSCNPIRQILYRLQHIFDAVVCTLQSVVPHTSLYLSAVMGAGVVIQQMLGVIVGI